MNEYLQLKALVDAVIDDNLYTVAMLLPHVKTADWLRCNPMAKAKSINIARLLLDAGADPNKGHLTRLPIVNAIEDGNEPMVRLLVRHGATVTDTPLPTRLGLCNMLQYACSRSAFRSAFSGAKHNDDIVILLLVCGADPHCVDTTYTKKRIYLLAAAGDKRYQHVSPRKIAQHRRSLQRCQMSLICDCATEAVIGLHSLDLPAFVTCAILQFLCEPFSNCLPFHCFWKFAVAAKHFK